MHFFTIHLVPQWWTIQFQFIVKQSVITNKCNKREGFAMGFSKFRNVEEKNSQFVDRISYTLEGRGFRTKQVCLLFWKNVVAQVFSLHSFTEFYTKQHIHYSYHSLIRLNYPCNHYHGRSDIQPEYSCHFYI